MGALDLFDLSGKGIGVTGGGGHLGAAMALALAGAGAVVVITGRNVDKLADVVAALPPDTTGRVVAHVADASSDEAVEQVLDRIEREAGVVAGWVNNAYAAPIAGLLDATREQVDETLERGLSDVIVATQLAAKRMVGSGGGSIVNVASMYGLVSPQPEVYDTAPQWHSPPAYGAAKAGVVQFTRYAAVHLASQGIRVNALSPGPFPKPAVVDADPVFARQLVARVPLRRLGAPEDLRAAIVFLLSDGASFVTGHNLVVDGGWTAW